MSCSRPDAQVFAEDHSNDDVLALIPLARSTSNANGGFVVAGQLQHQVKLNPDSSTRSRWTSPPATT